MEKTILDLCGGTGAWSKPYRDAGYNVLVIDPYANTGDVRLFEKLTHVSVYGILCAPPCTMFAGSGARWKRTDQQMIDALSIVDACLRIVAVHAPKFWVLENPIGKLVRFLGKPQMYFNPCDYGDPYTKKTCLWGEFNAPVKTPVEPTEGSKLHKLPPSPDRARLRSITPHGFAQAFFKANQ